MKIGVTGALVFLLTTQAFAMDVPISQIEQNINGQQTITQVFEVPVDTDPQTLIVTDMEKNGFSYELESIVKDVDTESSQMDVSQTIEIPLTASGENSARAEAIKYMKPSIEYDDGEFSGTLYVDPGSLELAPVNERTVYGTKTVTRQFTNEYNDDSVIPETISDSGYQYSLAGVTWAEGDMDEDGAVPVNYVATVTYRRGTSSVVNDGYTATVTYSGVVGHTVPETVWYTLVYYGYPIIVEEPGFFDRLRGDTEPRVTVAKPGSAAAGAERDASNEETKSLLPMVVGIVLCALGTALGIWLLIRLARRLTNHVATVYARDEHSGVDYALQRVAISKKKPSVSIKYLKAPSSKHFLVVLKRKLAGDLLGRNVTVQVGKQVFEHTVGPCYGDTYHIPIEVD